MRRYQRIARIGALQKTGDNKSIRKLRRHILHRVDGKVDTAFDQRFLDLFGEEAFAAQFFQLAILDSVASCLDDDDIGLRQVGPTGRQLIAHQVGLGESQRTSARPDA